MRSSTAAILLLCAACGARDALLLPAFDEPGGAAPIGGQGGGQGLGGQNVGGVDPPACDALVVAGDPVFIEAPLGNNATAPHLIDVGAGRAALVFESDTDSQGAFVSSVAIDGAFETWPPGVGVAARDYPAGNLFAVGDGPSGAFSFAAIDYFGDLIVGESAPAAQASILYNVSGFLQGPTRTLARAPDGRYFLDVGNPTARAILTLPGGEPPPSGSGCAEPLLSSASFVGDRFVLAQGAGQSCASPPDRLELVSSLGGVVSQPLSDVPVVQVVGAARGSELLIGVKGAAGSLRVWRSGPELDLSGGPVELPTLGPSSRHAIAPMDDAIAIADLLGNDAQPGGELVVALATPDGGVVLSPGLAPFGAFPMGAPALLVDSASRSLLVAFESQAGVGPTLGLARFDCVTGL